MRGKRRWGALLASVMMVLTMVPAVAFADVDASQVDPAKGYEGAELPAAPEMNGDVWTVTPENAQYTLDGAYGSIDGKTIHFSSGEYTDVLVINRATKYVGSNTLYYNMTYSTEEGWVKNETACNLTDLTSNIRTYERTVSNVTFTADNDVVLPGFSTTSGHIYGSESASAYDYVIEKTLPGTAGSYHAECLLSNITFDGLTIKDNVAVGDYYSGGGDTAVDGLHFIGCTFQGDESRMATNGYTAIRMMADSKYFKDIEVTDCNFSDYFQGVYVQGTDGLTVSNSVFDNTTHNAIAVQSGNNSSVRGEISITENIIKRANDRAIRFGDVGSGTTAVVNNNVMIDSGDSEGELIKAQNIVENATFDLEYNYWDGKEVTTAVPDGNIVRPVTTGIVSGVFPEEVTEYLSQDAVVAASFTSNGETKYLVGPDAVNEALGSASSGDVLTILSISEETTFTEDVAEGVTIINNGGSQITVGGVEIPANEQVTIGEEEMTTTEPSNQGSQEGTIKPDKTAQTGDDTDLALIAGILALAAAGAAGVLLYDRKRREN